MKLKHLLADDDAVSPVIGVILMVAITVILAAVIATFVLGLGEQVSSTAPQASFTFEYAEIEDGTDGNLTITHDGGDSIQTSELFIRGQNGTNADNSYNYNDKWGVMSNNNVGSPVISEGSTSGEISGESAVVAGDFLEFPIGSDGKIRVVYQAQEGDTSATLGTWEGPEA